MASRSAGLLMYRLGRGRLEVFLVHPGGPYFRDKDDGAWSIPKGEVAGGDDALTTAFREFEEETGIRPPPGRPANLGSIRQRGGKVVEAWALEGDCPDGFTPSSNTFEMEWPPRSGRRQVFPEVDRAAFFDAPTAKLKINPAQAALIDRLDFLEQQPRR